MKHLPEDLLSHIITFLGYNEYGILRQVCKSIPRIVIPYKTYSKNTYYKEGDVEYVQTSYLLTNCFYEKNLPEQIKHNFVEIQLCYGHVKYYFIIYKEVYARKKNILDYLENLDWRDTYLLMTSV